MRGEEEKDIKDVAVYLRKSRGEEDDLDKHRTLLTDICRSKGWRYVEYAEIGTSDSIDLRPKMVKLLKDIEEGLYDAVVCIDFDRLSRGDGEEQARIKNILRRTDTYIVTPQNIFDLNDDTDDMITDFSGFIARQEYKQIKKRLRRGKKIGAKLGNWTNGSPPYPYEYQEWYDEKTGKMYKNEKGLVVNRDKLKVYRYLLESVIERNISAYELAWELNRKGIPAPRGSRWYNETIGRILKDETHLGKVISNKSKGDGHRIKKSKDSKEFMRLPKEEWVIVENCHEAVKTLEEHEKVLRFFARETPTPRRRGIKHIYPLSGLVKCAKCGRTMIAWVRPDRHNKEYIKNCWYKDAFGNKCPNRGIVADVIYEAIWKELALYEEALKKSLHDGDGQDEEILKEIDLILTQINKVEKRIEKVDQLVEDEYYELDEGRKRKTELKEKLDELETRSNLLQIRLKNSKGMTNQERLNVIDKFKKNMQEEKNLTGEQLNKYYKSIISYIVWERTKDDKISIDVNFL